MRTAICLAIAALASEPAFAQTLAQSGTQVPEPSNIALFGLGLLGLIVGRQMSKSRRSDED